jgi:uracil phosphoribosyltransferase
LATPIIPVPILCADLGLFEGMLRVLPEAGISHIGLYRDEETLRPVGMDQLHRAHPDVPVITAAIDPELNEFGLHRSRFG